MRINYILFILKMYNELSDIEVSRIAGMSPEDIFKTYKKFLTLLEKLEEVENSDARRLLKDIFREVLIDLCSMPSDESDPLT